MNHERSIVMLKQEFIIRRQQGFEKVTGYVTEDGKYGIDKRKGECQPNKDFWYITDIPTGLLMDSNAFTTRKAAVADIARLDALCTDKKLRETAKYKDALAELNEFKGIKTESEDKKMAKTNKSAKANAKAKANKPNETARLEGENVALRKEIEMLKAQIQALQPKAEKPKAKAVKPTKKTTPKATIDTFDVAKYLESRDNSARVTPELVKAFENTDDLKIEIRGADGWLYVTGKTIESTKSRMDIFKALGMRFSGREKAWYLAPYPLRSRKSWSAKKARAGAELIIRLRVS